VIVGSSMECSCPASMTRVLYADIQLFPESKGGLSKSHSHSLPLKVVTICTRCGRANFSIEKSELRMFGQEQPFRTQ
jgi:ribosomal protein L37E